jgi:hypothetical protein
VRLCGARKKAVKAAHRFDSPARIGTAHRVSLSSILLELIGIRINARIVPKKNDRANTKMPEKGLSAV